MLRRRKKDAAREPRAPSTRSISGVIAGESDDDSLPVTLTIGEDMITLHTEDVELGSWTRREAAISAADEGRFELRAEGDRLDFVPDDPEGLASILEPAEAAKPPRRRRRKQAPPRSEGVEKKTKREGRWVRTLDRARPYSVFGLDRVPVDVALRGVDHTHTWDHRAAAPSGPSKHICTVCGKIRLRTGSAR